MTRRGTRSEKTKTFAIDRFAPDPDVREHHEITINVPDELVFEVARNFDMQSIPIVRAIFWFRVKLRGATIPAVKPRTGLVAGMMGLGWGCLAEVPDRLLVAGAACQTLKTDVVFSLIASAQFAAYPQPDRVKIAWTPETEALGPALTRSATDTRAVTADDLARTKFRRYWRVYGIDIVMIRRLLLPALCRQAEREWRSGHILSMSTRNR